MVNDKIIRTGKNPARADKAAVGAINRPLQGVGVEYSIALSIPAGVRSSLLLCIIGPLQRDGQGGQTPEAHICAPACRSWYQLHSWHTPQQRIESHVSF
jgi:hypothetical protein